MFEALEPAFRSILVTEILMAFAVVAFGVFTVRLLKSIQEDRKGWLLLGGIILAGLLLRMGWIAFTQPEPRSDFAVYWQYAKAFYHGDLTYNVIIRHPGTIILYTFAFFLFGGPSLLAGWVFNLLIAAILMLLVYALTRNLLGRTPAMVTTAMAALFPQLITYSALMSTEAPATAFSLMVLWAVLYSRERDEKRQWLYWMGIGELLYGTVLIRSSNLLFLILIPAIFLLTRRDQWKTWAVRYTLMAVTTCAMLSTWVYHQYLVGGSPRLFWGDALWMVCAINYERQGGYTTANELPLWPKVEPAFRQYEKTRSVRDEVKYYDVLSAEVMKVVEADPGKYLINGFPRLKRTLWTSQTGLRWTQRGSELMKRVPEKAVQRMATVSNVIWQILLCLSPLGFLCMRRSSVGSRENFLFILSYLATWFAFYFILAEANERYSFQILPFVLMLATGTLSWMVSVLRKLFWGNDGLETTSQAEQPTPSVI